MPLVDTLPQTRWNLRLAETWRPMTSRIVFYVPRNPQKQAVDFTLASGSFLDAQFVELAYSLAVPPINHSSLLAAALDCGYGSNSSALLATSASAWKDLCIFSNRRRKLAFSLIDSPAPNIHKRKTFVGLLEKTASAAAAFTLGQIFCRFATDHWHGIFQKNTSVKRFWHMHVAAHPAVSLQGAGPSIRALNPAYLVQDSHNNWSAVEAKGSLGDLNRRRLRDGLRQATKFPGIRFVDPLNGNERTESIDSSVCVSTYFDASSNELQVLHLDPPRTGCREDGFSDQPVVIAEAWDLARNYEAALLYLSYARGRKEIEGGAIGGFSTRRVAIRGANCLGITQRHASMRPYLRWSIHALSLITPIVSFARRLDSQTIRKDSLLQRLRRIEAALRQGSPQTQGDMKRWRLLLESLHSTVSEAGGVNWKVLLQATWTAPVIDERNLNLWSPHPQSIYALWSFLDDTMTSLREHQDLQDALIANRKMDLWLTSHGLTVSGQREPRC